MSTPQGQGLPLLREIKLNSGLAALELDALVARLHELAVAAIPGVGVLNALQRRLLGGLAERGLVVREDNSACLRSVAYQQAGEAMLAALAGAPEEQRQAYRQPGFTLRDLVQALLQRRLLSTGTVGKTEYLWCQLWWLPAGCTAAAAPRPPSQQRAEPLPPGAQPAATPLSGVQEVELAPQPALSKGKLSPSNAIMFFHQALSLLLPGDDGHAELQRFAVTMLLHMGLVKVAAGQSRFRHDPVPLRAAQRQLEAQLAQRRPGIVRMFTDQYGGSLAALLATPTLARLVRVEGGGGYGSAGLADDGWQTVGVGHHGGPHIQVLLGPLLPLLPKGLLKPQQPAAVPKQPASGPAPAVQQAPPAPQPTPAPALQLAATAAAATAAVQGLLARGTGQLGMACSLGPSGSLWLLAVAAPGGIAACFNFAGDERAGVAAALKPLLESDDVVVHDCRAASQALCNAAAITLGGVWDTQVAFGLVQHLSVLGSAAAEEGVDPPTLPESLLSLYELAQRASDAQPAALLAATAAALLEAQLVQQTELGPTASGRVGDLSRAWSRWHLDLAALTGTARPPRQWLSHLLDLAPLAL